MGKRDSRIDFLRGICILGMIAWHLLTADYFPRWLSFPIIQSVNFVAEGFVFLAGVSVSLVSFKPGFRYSQFLRRSIQILFIHYSILASLLILDHLGIISIKGVSGESFSDVIYAVITLKYQPYLADVLTVFVFLFLIAPGLLMLARSCGHARLLALSFVVFVVWQPWAIGNRWQLNSHGAFDVNTWQFVFCLGIVAGSFAATPSLGDNRKPWRALVFFLMATLVFGTVRLLTLTEKLPFFSEQSYGRHPLTLMRLLYISSHFLLVASATYIAWPKINRSRIARLVVHFGRHSLLVFSVSVPLDYLAKAFLDLFDASIVLGVLVLCLEIALLWIVVQVFECWTEVRKQNDRKLTRK